MTAPYGVDKHGDTWQQISLMRWQRDQAPNVILTEAEAISQFALRIRGVRRDAPHCRTCTCAPEESHD